MRKNPYFYSFKVQCTLCREIHPNWVSFNRFEQHEIPGSRGEANFVWKCRLCTRTHSASIAAAPASYEQSKNKGQKVIEFDCRGLEFTEFKADGDWEAKGIESSTNFSGIDLTDGEWYDYDEKMGEEVSIKEFIPMNPRPFLQSLISEDIVVRLKWGHTEYKGQLISVDSYMNIQLSNTEEFIDGKSTGSLGQVLIRCNNVLWISAAKDVKMNDVQMAD
ncbi:DUF866 domain-containing protein [Paracoccidioides lutzii Pb01]|uniref:Sm protein F n=1 Tax=Paracoccidioides lutzii (strain ATCC MYA-826 / Pb01) TaxID=502779 RepID=C1GZE6_PARBA|nr:DUF866 domain-containing protein [Paracoccidioides lutzii Pb01]EEH41969.2 DUF866 domain-containing protein [Paracoccidioides lutzii Pb01]